MPQCCRALVACAVALLSGAPAYAAADPAARPAQPKIVSQAGNPRISVGVAALVGGRLFIRGFARDPDTLVTIRGTPFQVLAHPGKTFSFNVDHRTPDCRITLETPTGALQLRIDD